MKRNDFIRTTFLGACAVPVILSAYKPTTNTPLEKALVEEFVNKAHSDKDIVLAMLDEHPTLLNAAHDWGSGDFETALGAASHVGYKELVSYLISMGAQTNIFTACLFGHLDIVKPVLEKFPASLNAKGPHGFTLLHHAIKGGDDAMGVKSYLESLGAVETRIPLY